MSQLLTTATRYHDISCGHRVVGHENKCRNLHGHNYRMIFTIGCASLDKIGRVLDFSVIKSVLCEWLENEWDHRMLIWEKDPMLESLKALDSTVVAVPFNPTAENMAEHLVKVVGPRLLSSLQVTLLSVVVEETRKCSAEVKYVTHQ